MKGDIVDTMVGNTGDTISAVLVIGVVGNILPPIAAALAIIWTLIRIYEWFRMRILGLRDIGKLE